MKDLFSILRIHIVLIGIFGAMVFGWLLTDRYLWWVALIGGVDWLLINLANRVSDLREDRRNAIPGSERIAADPTRYLTVFFILLIGSFAVTALLFPELTGWRLFMQFVGFIYNFRVIPWPGGPRRLKDIYLLKNLMSALGFVTTCFGYTLAYTGYQPLIGWTGTIALILFFIPFELTYEILYDLRDVEGDRAQGVPTYPVAHGEAVTQKIINTLLPLSVAVLVVSFFLGFLGVKEILIGAGPIIQFFLFRPMLRRGPTTGDCIFATNFGVALLVVYLAVTRLWLDVGLPENIYFS